MAERKKKNRQRERKQASKSVSQIEPYEELSRYGCFLRLEHARLVPILRVSIRRGHVVIALIAVVAFISSPAYYVSARLEDLTDQDLATIDLIRHVEHICMFVLLLGMPMLGFALFQMCRDVLSRSVT